jgi:hypothetical protein
MNGDMLVSLLLQAGRTRFGPAVEGHTVRPDDSSWLQSGFARGRENQKQKSTIGFAICRLGGMHCGCPEVTYIDNCVHVLV